MILWVLFSRLCYDVHRNPGGIVLFQTKLYYRKHHLLLTLPFMSTKSVNNSEILSSIFFPSKEEFLVTIHFQQILGTIYKCFFFPHNMYVIHDQSFHYEPSLGNFASTQYLMINYLFINRQYIQNQCLLSKNLSPLSHSFSKYLSTHVFRTDVRGRIQTDVFDQRGTLTKNGLLYPIIPISSYFPLSIFWA